MTLFARLTFGATLYAALLAMTSPTAAQAEGAPPWKAEAEALRVGDMRKLIFNAAPLDRGAIGFTDKAGGPTTLGESNGKVRIVNFWATWCAPCRTEKPSLDALQAALGGVDFEVIAIATGRNSLKAIEKFNSEVGIAHLTTYLDPNSAAAREMAVLGLPVSVILDREGREIARLTGGAEWDSDSARAILARLMAAEG